MIERDRIHPKTIQKFKFGGFREGFLQVVGNENIADQIELNGIVRIRTIKSSGFSFGIL